MWPYNEKELEFINGKESSMVKPNFNFELNLEDIELIEYSLTNQINELSKKHWTQHWTHTNESDEHFEKIKEIHQLLGKIHNQKIWYRPQKSYVSG